MISNRQLRGRKLPGTGLAAVLWIAAATVLSMPAVVSAQSPLFADPQAQTKPVVGKQTYVQGVAPAAVTGVAPGAYSNLGQPYGNQPYDRNNPYCRPCARRDLECKRLQRRYCPGQSAVPGSFSSQGITVGVAPAYVQGVPDGGIGGYGAGISNGAAGSMTFPGNAAVNLGIPFTRSDAGNAIAARYMSAEAAYQMQLYQWEVARVTAEWQAMKAAQLRREEEWNAKMQRQIDLQQEAALRAQQEEEAKQQAAAEPQAEPAGFASFFSIRSSQPAAQPEEAELVPTEKAEGTKIITAGSPTVKTPAQLEAAQRPAHSEAEKASVLRHFKRALFGI